MTHGGIDGGCNCGAVRYTISSAPASVAICHCRNCQRQSGGAFSINLVVARAAMQIRGELLSYEDRDTESGAPVDRQSCARCGSQILSILSSAPELAIVKAGTADEPERFEPTIHVWTSSALPWVEIPPDLPQFPQNAG